MANNQGRKQVIIVKSMTCMSIKIVLKNFIPVVKYSICLMLKKEKQFSLLESLNTLFKVMNVIIRITANIFG